MVTTRLVDSRATLGFGGWPLSLVEVHQARLAPLPELQRFWRPLERVDTVPFVRSLGTVAVIGDTAVIGLGGTSVTAWRYDVRTKVLTRTHVPGWLKTAWMMPPPALSPDGRFIAYLSQDRDTTRLTVRTWPQGAPVWRSPRVQPRVLNPPRAGAILWSNPQQLQARVAVFDSGPSFASLLARVTDAGLTVERWTMYADREAMMAIQAALHPPATPDSVLQARFTEAESKITALPVSAFPELPAEFVRQLREAGCTVPQDAPSKQPHNVIHGTFAAPQQLDWAVLCRHGARSVIRIWFGGPVRCPREVNWGANRSFLEGYGDQIVFARVISATNAYTASGEVDSVARTTRLEHDAIVDAFSDKYQTILMCRDGRWISLGEQGE